MQWLEDSTEAIVKSKYRCSGHTLFHMHMHVLMHMLMHWQEASTESVAKSWDRGSGQKKLLTQWPKAITYAVARKKHRVN